MATIRILRRETDGDTFPRMCIRCGEPTDDRVPQSFAWMPGWVHVFLFVGGLPWLVAAAVTRKTMTVDVPVCHRHRNHWWNRKLYVGLGLLFWIAAGVTAAVMVHEIPEDTFVGVVAGIVFGALAWLIVGVVLVTRAVRAAEIRETGIELTNVNKQFAVAWHGVGGRGARAVRPEPEEDDEDDRPRYPWGRGRGE